MSAPDSQSREVLYEKIASYAASRDRELRSELIAEHLWLVRQLSQRFAHRGEALDDLIQAGSIGLIKAIDNFDPTLGFEFNAYATTTILGELKRHFRDKGWSVHTPRRIQELYLAIGSAVDELTQRLGRSPTMRELSLEIGADEDAVLEAMDAGLAYRATSLDAPLPSGEALGQQLGSSDPGYESAEIWATLKPRLDALSERERQVIELRFGQDLTQVEIASALGISQMHVSRIISRILTSLRTAFGDS